MPTPTYVPLSAITLSSLALEVSFTSIAQTYKDLVLVISGTAGAAPSSVQPVFRFNSDSENNYFYVFARGNGSSTSSGADVASYNFGIISASVTSGRFLCISNIMDYSATDKHKTVLTRGNDNDANSDVQMMANRWANTAAITSIQLINPGGSWPSGSTFTLFGIAG